MPPSTSFLIVTLFFYQPGAAVDILVFPEYGLTGEVSDPGGYAVEIHDSDDVIIELIAMALERNMYIVVNLLEKVQDGTIYNTNLVFDREGNITAKYRKINLFNERNLTPGAPDQNATFTTDFGVTFGLFTGSDIFFKNPSRSISEVGSVTDVIYPTSRLMARPFQIAAHGLMDSHPSIVEFITPTYPTSMVASMTSQFATSIQHAYSVSQRVNVLAANSFDLQDGHSGSGIYLFDGSEPKISTFGGTGTKLIVAKIKKRNTKPGGTSCSSLTPADQKRRNKNNKSIGTNVGYVSQEICVGEFCCNFSMTVYSDQPFNETYKLRASGGIVYLGADAFNIKSCSLVLCENELANSKCGMIKNASTTFRRIMVRATLPSEDETIYSPISLNYNVQPSISTVFCDTDNATGSVDSILYTTEEQDGVLMFGLMALTISGSPPIYSLEFFVTLVIVISARIFH